MKLLLTCLVAGLVLAGCDSRRYFGPSEPSSIQQIVGSGTLWAPAQYFWNDSLQTYVPHGGDPSRYPQYWRYNDTHRSNLVNCTFSAITDCPNQPNSGCGYVSFYTNYLGNPSPLAVSYTTCPDSFQAVQWGTYEQTGDSSMIVNGWAILTTKAKATQYGGWLPDTLGTGPRLLCPVETNFLRIHGLPELTRKALLGGAR